MNGLVLKWKGLRVVVFFWGKKCFPWHFLGTDPRPAPGSVAQKGARSVLVAIGQRYLWQKCAQLRAPLGRDAWEG